MLSDRNTGLCNCQKDNEPNQNPLEAPENDAEDVENEVETDVQSKPTEYPADNIEDPNEQDKNNLDDHESNVDSSGDSNDEQAIDWGEQTNCQSDLHIDLGPDNGAPMNFQPVTAPDMLPVVSCY
ncbi:hypothetical protein PCASD_03695 [Puccinia coronata f. sp. avenae]|uniref:Uncharacterized protein n=1 Tax=Puccinia coronata f. sp. avenae TaxID=200324 RepID=A0A2N5V9S9_9BASI|nr:hypothetical protein PCASD_03695 [Puccinia coronata f. sp. avenae]